MKTILRFIALATALCTFGACDDDHSYTDDTPKKIVHSQIAGTWCLTAWNGADVTEGLYFYLTLDSKEKRFEIYQNFDSAKARHLTGTYTLTYDEKDGNTIDGIYDHASGAWSHAYRIGDFTQESMSWTVEDDASDVSVYTRCDGVPEDILNGTRTEF